MGEKEPDMTDKLNPDKIGIRVICTECGRQKAPRGRSASPLMTYCLPPFWGPQYGEPSCNGYYEDPKVGSLWPGESEEDFGYPVENDGTTLSNKEVTQ